MPQTPLVLIPGLMCTGDLFRDQILALSHARPVHVADHRRADGVEEIAAQILREAPAQFALAGLSMGGYLALEIMRRAPRRVTRLALLDTSAAPDTPAQTALRRERIEAAHAGRYLETAQAMFPGFVHADRAGDATLKARFLAMAEETGAAAFVRQQKAIIGRPDSRPYLSAIKVPTLVMVGEQDAATPVEQAQVITQGIAGAQLVVIPDCGHLATMERPEAATAAMAAWLG